MDPAAAFIEALLRSAPGVTILATTRERLRAEGEWVHQPSPLEAPPKSSTLYQKDYVGGCSDQELVGVLPHGVMRPEIETPGCGTRRPTMRSTRF
jgi:hypothetical protein